MRHLISAMRRHDLTEHFEHFKQFEHIDHFEHFEHFEQFEHFEHLMTLFYDNFLMTIFMTIFHDFETLMTLRQFLTIGKTVLET